LSDVGYPSLLAGVDAGFDSDDSEAFDGFSELSDFVSLFSAVFWLLSDFEEDDDSELPPVLPCLG
jgi:hypothetical protein